MVGVRLLGPVGVVANGGAVPLGGGRQQALFAMLAAHTPPRRTDQQIIEGLWGEDPPASARNAVQVYVSGLRKALASVGVGIVRDGDGYALAGTPLTVDGASFETAVAQGRAALRAGAPADAVDHLTRANAMWAGAPLDGLGDLAFTGPIRLHLAATRRAAMIDLATALLRCRRYDDAVDIATELLTEHPYDERGWVALATGHYWAGRQDEALAACRQAREMLAGELGVDPGPELAGIEQQVLRHELPDPAHGAVAPEPEPEEEAAPPVPLLPPLPDHVVGRDDAIDQLLGVLGDGARLVTMLGIGGIGKTTLALAVAHRLRADDRTIVFCELATETEASSALEAVCRVLGQDPGDDAVAVIAANAPDVLVLDNLEQVAGLAQPLALLLQSTESLTVVATSRRPLRVLGEHEYHVPPLLSAGEEWRSPAEELFRARARRVRADVDSDPAAVRELVTLLDGIPLAIELAAGRVRSQSPAQLLARITAGRTAMLDLTDDVGRPARQLSLRVVLEAAVEAASPGARSVLEALAWCDGWLSQDSLEAVLSRTSPAADPVSALDELITSGLLAPPEDDRVRLSVPVREFVRERYGDTAAGDAVVEVVLELAEQLGPRLAGEDAGTALARLSADADAISTVVTRAVQERERPPQAARLILALRRYWLMTSRLPEIRRSLAAIRDTAALDETTDARLGIMDGTAGQWLGLPDAVEVLEQALAETDRLRATPDQLIVAGWCNLAAAAAVEGDAERAHAALDRATHEAALTDDDELVDMAGDLRGFVAAQLGDHTGAVEAGLASLERARRTHDDLVLLERLVGVAESLFEVGRDDEGLAAAREAFDLMGSLPASPSTAAALAVAGLIETVAGDLHVGIGQTLEALRFCRDRYPAPRLTADLLVILAAARVTSQRDADAASLIGASDAIRRRSGLDADGPHETRLWRLALLARERLGEDAWRLHTARGAASADRLVARLLDGTEDLPVNALSGP